MGFKASASSRLFVLTKGALGSRYDTDVETVDPVNRADAPRCPQCGDIIGMRTWLPPYRVKLELYGEELGDFIRDPGDAQLISEQFTEAFRAEGLTGLEGFHPVEVLRVRSRKKKAGKPITVPRYYVVSPCFGRAAVDLVLNRVRFSKPLTCSECRSTGIEAINGFILEPGTWGGRGHLPPPWHARRHRRLRALQGLRQSARVDEHGAHAHRAVCMGPVQPGARPATDNMSVIDRWTLSPSSRNVARKKLPLRLEPRARNEPERERYVCWPARL